LLLACAVRAVRNEAPYMSYLIAEAAGRPINCTLFIGLRGEHIGLRSSGIAALGMPAPDRPSEAP